MAGYIDKFKVGSTEYEIQAKSGTDHSYYVDKTTTAVSADGAKTATVVGSAKGINSTNKISLSGQISGDDLIGTAISAAKTINTRITTTPWSAISGTDASGAASNLTSASTTWSSTNERFLTPNKVYGYVSAQVSGIAEANGIYQVKGNSTFTTLTADDKHKNGYVYNLSDSGSMPAESAYNGQTFDLQPGDNVVWIQDATSPGWDKIANPAEAAISTLEKWSDASATWNSFNTMTGTINSNSANNWANSKHNLFSVVNTPNGNLSAGAYNSTISLSALPGISAGGTSPTAAFRFSGVSGFKTIKVTNAGGTTANVDAAAYSDQLTLVAGANISLNPTVDTNGNPTISIAKIDTTYTKATTAALGMVQKSYYTETDTTNHIGSLVIQGNMSASTFNTP